MLEVVDVAVCRYRSSDLVVRYCNAAWATAHGAEPADVQGRPLTEILDADELADELTALPEVTSAGRAGPTERTRSRGPGRTVVETWSHRSLPTPDGLDVVTWGHDVTERVRSTRALAAAEARSRGLVEALPVPAYRRTRWGVITQVNPAAAAWLQRPAESLVGTNVLDLIAPADQDRVREQLLAEAVPESSMVHFRCGDRYRLAQVAASSLPQGGSDEVLVVVHDVTEADAAHRALEAARRRTEVVLGALDTAVLLHDETGRVQLANPAAAELFGEVDADAMVGTHTDTLLSDALHGSGRPLGAGAAVVRRALESGPTQVELGLPIEGGVRWLRVVAVAVPAEEGTSVVCALTDVTASHEDRAALERAALTDPLTGLANRTALLHDLGKVLEADVVDGALLFIDLDRFKPVNDLYGHEVGDQLLVAVAGRLRHRVSATDTVARVGGDEFVVLARGVRDGADLGSLAGRIRAALRAPFELGGVQVSIDGSVGAALLEAGMLADEVLSDADQRMYAAKRRHKRERAASDGDGPVGWSVALALGVARMDRDHHRLVTLLARVADRLEAGDGVGGLAVLDELVAETTTHFATEEALMVEAGYPALAGHQVEHRRLLASITRYRGDLAAGTGATPAVLVALLSEWLSNHITGADRVLAEFLHRKRPDLAAPLAQERTSS